LQQANNDEINLLSSILSVISIVSMESKEYTFDIYILFKVSVPVLSKQIVFILEDSTVFSA
jgi:hypothetical protein